MNDAYFSKWHCHKIYSCRSNLRQLRPNSTCCVTSRHDTTRYLAHVFWHRKKSWRAASRLSDSTARHARHDKRDNCDSHDTCSGSPPQCGLGWTSPPHFFQKLFLRLTQIQSTEDKLLHASTTASSSSAMLEQSRRYTHDARDTHVSWRNLWNLGFSRADMSRNSCLLKRHRNVWQFSTALKIRLQAMTYIVSSGALNSTHLLTSCYRNQECAVSQVVYRVDETSSFY